jgi:hypothetical protein
VIEQGISPCYLDSLFPEMLKEFDPQHVVYNGGIAKLKEWKISCYLEVMESDVPCTNPNTKLLQLFEPLLDTCNDLFLKWYRQLHASFVQTDHDLYHKVHSSSRRTNPNEGEFNKKDPQTSKDIWFSLLKLFPKF